MMTWFMWLVGCPLLHFLSYFPTSFFNKSTKESIHDFHHINEMKLKKNLLVKETANDWKIVLKLVTNSF